MEAKGMTPDEATPQGRSRGLIGYATNFGEEHEQTEDHERDGA